MMDYFFLCVDVNVSRLFLASCLQTFEFVSCTHYVKKFLLCIFRILLLTIVLAKQNIDIISCSSTFVNNFSHNNSESNCRFELNSTQRSNTPYNVGSVLRRLFSTVGDSISTCGG